MLLGKMDTMVSIRLGASDAWYSSPDTCSTGKKLLNMLARIRPMITATAVVHM